MQYTTHHILHTHAHTNVISSDYCHLSHTNVPCSLGVWSWTVSRRSELLRLHCCPRLAGSTHPRTSGGRHTENMAAWQQVNIWKVSQESREEQEEHILHCCCVLLLCVVVCCCCCVCVCVCACVCVCVCMRVSCILSYTDKQSGGHSKAVSTSPVSGIKLT